MDRAFLIGTVLCISSLSAATETIRWDLQKCIEYALENNLQIQRLKLDRSGTDLSYNEAKASQYPSVSGSIGYSLSPDISSIDSIKNLSQSGRYSLSAGWTAFKGNAIRNDIKIKQLEIHKSDESIKSQEISLIQNLTNAYLQVFYSKEALSSSQMAFEISKVQRDRTAELLAVGSATKVDLAKMDASLATDQYNMVVARNTLRQKERALKSLMEIPVDTPLTIYFPDLSDTLKLTPIPDIQQIYSTALEKMPGIAGSELNRQIANLTIKKSIAGFLPTLNINAGLSTNNRNVSSSFSNQVSNNAKLDFGANLSIPIYDNRKTKTNIEKARISARQAELALAEEKKALLEEVENIYYEAISARSKLDAANIQYEKSLQSYEIAQEQFKLGMINSTDLLVEKNNYLVSLREQLQSKINALMQMQMINIYMGIPVQL